MLNLAKHVHAKFQLSIFYPDGLRQNFDHFSRKIQNFLKENLEFSKSVCHAPLPADAVVIQILCHA
jgi:hypothetical protein